MPSNTYPLIAKEGRFVLVILIIGIILAYFYLGTAVTIVMGIIFCIAISFITAGPRVSYSWQNCFNKSSR
jgi:hypothetical protein